MRPHALPFSYIFRNPRRTEVDVPFEGDIEEWLTKLEVYTPFDDGRKSDLDAWKCASDKAHGEAFYALLSVVDAMESQIYPKPPLQVKFPRPDRGSGRG